MKDIFSYNIDISKNAYMNWRTNKHEYIKNMIVMANGFMMSSIILVEQILNNNRNKNADIVIFPILFNANHSIELYLKAITWTLNIILDKDKKIEGKHNINQIFTVVCSRVNEFEKSKETKEQFKKLTINLKDYLDELCIKIEDKSDKKYKDNMDFSRYPFNTEYINHFYIDKLDNVVIDLENFLLRFKEIGKNLNTIAEHYLYDFLEADH
ncbi:hypothetical protein [Clostridium felsineum]|uniref:Uncharacterized protein n=1 Tax=Clostridium felsineum TaxID=36839 RepID=A0A1S8LWS4_9CLOT|nr:hypothetical protein [Clostridium felsineum]URZ05928.1 hypothetical protein CLROS_012600 [Clostridium felsineum]URZ10965.1 hypothetical protein CROST_016810 [Clostridium felsineum]